VSTDLLYHGFGIRGYRFVGVQYEQDKVIFAVQQEQSELSCPHCGQKNLIRRGTCLRRFRTLPIGATGVWIDLPVQRVECRSCGVVQQVQLGFADPRRSYTNSFERYAVDLCRVMTIQDVAEHLGVSWDMIKDMHKRHLWLRYQSPSLKDLTYIAIDEICVGHGRRFLTIVLNLKTGAVIFVGQGKGKDALEPFWKRLAGHEQTIQAVAIDMSVAYLAAVWEHLPKAQVVFDRFHVVKLYNEKLSELRRQVQNGANAMAKEVLKGTRWLLLKNPQNLDRGKNELRRLQLALLLNEPLACAYYLKEDLRQFWEQPDKATASWFLRDWIARAEASGITLLKKFAHTLRVYEFGLLAWYDHHISTGPLEGTNNKIKTLQRRAYGYRDQQYFTLRIYGLHETKYALVG
jgi:transposase